MGGVGSSPPSPITQRSASAWPGWNFQLLYQRLAGVKAAGPRLGTAETDASMGDWVRHLSYLHSKADVRLRKAIVDAAPLALLVVIYRAHKSLETVSTDLMLALLDAYLRSRRPRRPARDDGDADDDNDDDDVPPGRPGWEDEEDEEDEEAEMGRKEDEDGENADSDGNNGEGADEESAGVRNPRSPEKRATNSAGRDNDADGGSQVRSIASTIRSWLLPEKGRDAEKGRETQKGRNPEKGDTVE